MVTRRTRTGGEERPLETPEIMTKPLPQILDEMEANIRAAAAAAKKAEEAAKAAAEGKTKAEIIEQLEEQISRTHVFAALDTMEFLRRSGRVSGLVAGFGSLLQIKPLLKMFDGDPTSERVRTSNGAYKRMYELLKERAPFERIALVHTHAHEQVDSLLEYVQDLLPTSDLSSVDITPVIGAHIGPGAVGFACVSAKAG